MAGQARLSLPEEVLLLALRNEKGTVAAGVMFDQAAGAAILAELILGGRLRVVDEGKSAYAEVADSTPTGDGVVDECLEKVKTAKRRAKLATWVQRFGSVKQLKHRVAASLRDKRILREEEGRLLVFFTRRLYPELDGSHERAIVARLEAAIFSDNAPVDARTTVLVGIAHQAGLLKVNIDPKRLKSRKARITHIAAGHAVGKATKQAIEAVQAAIFAAVIVPAIVSAGH